MSGKTTCDACGGALGFTSIHAYDTCYACKQKKQKLRDASRTKATASSVSVATWETLMQTASAVTGGSVGGLKDTSAYIGKVMACLGEHKDDNGASTIDEQKTIWKENPTDSTVTVDYQGTRAGKGSTFWIDIQGQVGGGSTKRKTYWQIMVQCAGSSPPQGVVEAAIEASLKAQSGERAVIHLSTTTARPN